MESADFNEGAAAVSLLADAADGEWAVRAAKLVLHAVGGAWSWEG